MYIPFTDIPVTKACLGTMSFAAHVDEVESRKIMDMSVAEGCTFFDTAELYAVPPCAETYGKTEEIIGRWMKDRNNREEIVLATKVVGNGRKGHSDWIRGGETRLNKKHIRQALTDSLQRLGTDYIDLYQLHWPDRNVNKFGQRGFIPFGMETQTPIEETLQVLQEIQQEGLVKHFGISNETPWGTMEHIRLEKEKGYPKMVTVQNNYSLLTRTYDSSMAEISHREGIGLLAYSPLGYGALVEKQRKGGRFDTYPLSTHPGFVDRYRTEKIQNIVDQYKNLAHQYDITVEQLAIAFVASRKFVTSVIIGPATAEQCKDGIRACDIKLPSEIFEKIDAIHEQCPYPCA